MPRIGDPFICKNPRGVYVSHSPGQMLDCTLPFVRMVKFKFLAQLPVDYYYYYKKSFILLHNQRLFNFFYFHFLLFS